MDVNLTTSRSAHSLIITDIWCKIFIIIMQWEQNRAECQGKWYTRLIFPVVNAGVIEERTSFHSWSRIIMRNFRITFALNANC